MSYADFLKTCNVIKPHNYNVARKNVSVKKYQDWEVKSITNPYRTNMMTPKIKMKIKDNLNNHRTTRNQTSFSATGGKPDK